MESVPTHSTNPRSALAASNTAYSEFNITDPASLDVSCATHSEWNDCPLNAITTAHARIVALGARGPIQNMSSQPTDPPPAGSPPAEPPPANYDGLVAVSDEGTKTFEVARMDADFNLI